MSTFEETIFLITNHKLYAILFQRERKDMAAKLSYLPDLYLGEGIDGKKLDKIKKKLENKPLLSGVFLVALSRNPSDQLEIYSARQLAQRYYTKYPPCVVGIAANYDEAVEMVKRIARECMEERGDCALKEYLSCQM